jgi:hypothetical protein
MSLYAMASPGAVELIEVITPTEVQIPADIVFEIFSYLDVSSVLSASLVCRDWYEISSSLPLWCYESLVIMSEKYNCTLAPLNESYGINRRLFSRAKSKMLAKKRKDTVAGNIIKVICTILVYTIIWGFISMTVAILFLSFIIVGGSSFDQWKLTSCVTYYQNVTDCYQQQCVYVAAYRITISNTTKVASQKCSVVNTACIDKFYNSYPLHSGFSCYYNFQSGDVSKDRVASDSSHFAMLLVPTLVTAPGVAVCIISLICLLPILIVGVCELYTNRKPLQIVS